MRYGIILIKEVIFMKLLLAIVSNDDSNAVSKALNKEKYQVTKLATTGGFLSMGNTTLICGCDDDKVERAIELIGSKSKRRTEIVPSAAPYNSAEFITMPVEVTVGGATIFILNVDQFVKL